MALERLSLAPSPLPLDSSSVDAAAPSTDDANRAPRLPRWTRQEILVLIQGKKVAENRVRRGRTAGLAFGSGQVEPKWASVSSYCKRHGVNRGPVQCRKRWSNLAGDFKKIKEWESQIQEETDSFWVMRNDLRRDKKLPGFFDREVYDILDSSSSDTTPPALALALAPSAAAAGDDADPDPDPEPEPEPEPEEEPVLFDSGRSAAADDGLFSDFEQSAHDDVLPSPGSKLKDPSTAALPTPVPFSAEKQYQHASEDRSAKGTTNEKQIPIYPEVGTTHDGRKRKRLASDGEEETHLQHQLIGILERNGRMLSSQLEVQNANFQLDMEQRKDHGNNLIAVLSKLADALGRIADKL